MQRVGTRTSFVTRRSGSLAVGLGGLVLAAACGSSQTTGSAGPIGQSASALHNACTPKAKIEPVRTDGDAFLHRTGHQVVRVKDDIFIARGVENNIDTQTNTFRQDLFRLDPHRHDRATFRQLEENGASVPGPMAYPCMVGDDEGSGSLLLFGGAHYLFDLDPNFFNSFQPFDTLWQYRIATRTWTALAPAGTRPGARNGCNAALLDGFLYVFGGANRFLQLNNELWRFDLRAETWTLLAPTGPLPPPRFIAATVLDRETRKIYLYNGLESAGPSFRQIGDFWSYDIDANAWQEISATPTPPRAKGTFTLLRGPCDKRYLVYAGGNIENNVLCTGFDEETTATNEIWAFDLEAQTWTKLDTVGAAAPRLEFIQGATVDDRHYVAGGWFDVPDPVRICRQVWNEQVYALTLVDE